MITFLILITLILLNALYVAAEFAAVSVSRPRLQQLADEGSGAATELLPILSDAHSLDRYIAACQIGITLSSLILGAYGQVTLTGAIAPLLQGVREMSDEAALGAAALIVLLALTAVQMILSELLPKSIALRFSAPTVIFLRVPMLWSLRAFSPFIKFLNGSGSLVLRALRVPQTSHRHVHSADEMELLFGESRQGGEIEPKEHERLVQALQLQNRRVAEIMVPRPAMKALEVASGLDEVLEEMAGHPFTRWPVYEGHLDKIVGIAHARDVARSALDRSRPFDLRRVMRVPLVVHEAMTADDLLSIMRIEHKQLAIVIDEYGSPVGLVGVSDVLDELMGDIREGETTAEEANSVQTLPDGGIRVSGLLRLDELERVIGRPWRSSRTVTVAGKILEESGTLPREGQRLEIDGLRLTIDRLHALTIDSVVFEPIEDVVSTAAAIANGAAAVGDASE